MQPIKDTYITLTVKEDSGAAFHYAVSRTGNVEVTAKPNTDIQQIVKLISAIDDGFIRLKHSILKKRQSASSKLLSLLNGYLKECNLPEASFIYKADEANYLDMNIDFDDAKITLSVSSSLIFMGVREETLDAMAKFHAFDCLQSLVEFAKTDTRRYNAMLHPELAEELNNFYAPLEQRYSEFTEEEISEIENNHKAALETIGEYTKGLGTVHVARC